MVYKQKDHLFRDLRLYATSASYVGSIIVICDSIFAICKHGSSSEITPLRRKII